jgi:hypothetical protein
VAFQSSAFQNSAFQVEAPEVVCTPAFQPTAFQTDAFQVCDVEPGVCTPAFQPTAFQTNAFQVCPDTPVAQPIVIDQGDGRPRDRARAEFERRQDEWKADLRRIIERAFGEREEQQQAAPVEPLAKPEKRRMAQDILARTNFGPLQLSLAEIIAQIDAYQRALVIEQMRRDEDDAILALMLSD